jgi:polyvinyl alcohol dehydrogenase (cytochrome)
MIQAMSPGGATRLRAILNLFGGVIILGSPLAALAQPAPAPQSAQEAMFENTCAVCHDNPDTRAPARASLHAMSPDFIVDALTNGIMKVQAAALSPAQRASLAEYLTGQKLGTQTPMAGRCSETQTFSTEGPAFNGWGANPGNWRYQPEPGIDVEQVHRLDLKWAFGIPGVVAMFAQPTVVGGRVFIGGQNGHVYSLDAHSGCYFWNYAAGGGVRSAITVAHIGRRDLVLFGDRRGHVHALDAATGALVWKVMAAEGPAMQVTGAPTLFEGRLYVPISGGDDSAAMGPKYECCKGRGVVVALDAATGATVWTTYAIPEPKPLERNSVGTQLWGPSGASIWAAPTIDAKRQVLYVGTGDNHSAPATGTSDAVLALSLDIGRILCPGSFSPEIWAALHVSPLTRRTVRSRTDRTTISVHPPISSRCRTASAC